MKPSPSPLCLSAQTNYDKLESLAKEFNIAFDKAVKSGKREDVTETQRLKKEIEDISKWFENNCRMIESYQSFLKDTFTQWGWGQETLDKFKDTPISQNPRTIDWQTKETDIDENKLGEYTLNPETANINWANISPDKIKVFDLSNMQGKKLSEVAEYIMANYPSSKYKIPGLEYYKYILENPDKIPQDHSPKDGNYHFFFGSTFRGGDGHFRVPYAYWIGSEWRRCGDWLDDSWDSNCRLVLLET